MTLNREDIIANIRTVYDPEIPVNIWDLGLVYDIEINDADVVITMTFTSPTCPMMEELLEMVRVAVKSVPGVNDVKINLVWDPAWDISRMSETARLELDLTESGW
ncbi:iron-sulfur cluster assembly protein [Lachnospiraceae bacterium OttesenSCG-928-E19]|nr:iron-sulfur cluster assembly protein [Lachnospiraceae bacterium OttesenSCG-928-E19]